MDDETEDQRRIRLDGAQFAFTLVLRDLVCLQLPDEADRLARRETLCRRVEALYTADGLQPHAHDALQVALATIEAIYAPGQR